MPRREYRVDTRRIVNTNSQNRLEQAFARTREQFVDLVCEYSTLSNPMGRPVNIFQHENAHSLKALKFHDVNNYPSDKCGKTRRPHYCIETDQIVKKSTFYDIL